jgi:hypothetical protein
VRTAIHLNNAAHQVEHAAWMRDGMRRHGVDAFFAGFDDPVDADVHVVWGWRQHRVISTCRTAGRPILVMERGHIQPRMLWTSCGWGGLQNYATYPEPLDDGERFLEHFGHHLKPYDPGKDYVLLCGQVRGDASIGNLDIEAWGQATTDVLVRRGHAVRYRPHPLSVRKADNWHPKGSDLSLGRTLEEDLRGARACVIYSSTAGVEAAFAGVPVVALDKGAMAWPIASTSLVQPFRIPVEVDRLRWAIRLSWTQWTSDEIASGAAWDALAACMPTA